MHSEILLDDRPDEDELELLLDLGDPLQNFPSLKARANFQFGSPRSLF